jgi:hypothetical protein
MPKAYAAPPCAMPLLARLVSPSNVWGLGRELLSRPQSGITGRYVAI